MPVYFSPPEKEIIESLQEIYGITYIEAADQVIGQKRELAFLHQRRGNFALAENILKELNEWNDEVAQDMEKMKTHVTPSKKIILPD